MKASRHLIAGPDEEARFDTCKIKAAIMKRNQDFYGLLELDVCLLLRFLIVY